MSRTADRLTLLATFARIAARGSISAAARDLGIGQPAASRQLAELEARLGATLVRRTTHALSLTPAGEAALEDARAVLAAWETLEERHGGAAETAKGPLKIVAPVALGQRRLIAIALDLQRAHPGIALDWTLDDAPIRFAETGCDLWVRIGAITDDRLAQRALGRVERLLAASPALTGPASSPAALEAVPCAALEPFEGGRIGVTRGDGAAGTLRPTVRLSTNNIFALREAALAGAGFAVLPRWFIEEDLTAGRLIDALPGWRAASLTITAGWAPGPRQPLRLRLMLDALTAGVPAIEGVAAP
jgi:DNA-binding transcriptional LysR family regulator